MTPSPRSRLVRSPSLRSPSLRPLVLVFAVGCVAQPVERGDVVVCLDGERSWGPDIDLELSGTVTSIGAGDDPCVWGATLDDGAGTVASIGFGVRDAEGGDLTPPIDLVAGDTVQLTYRYRVVWGDVAGFVLSDGVGVVVAAEEGAWGGALHASDVPGLTVQRGEDVVATEPTECQPIEGYEIVYTGDEALTLTPVSSGTVQIGGAPLTAMALAAYDYGASATCQVADQTGETSWVVVR